MGPSLFRVEAIEITFLILSLTQLVDIDTCSDKSAAPVSALVGVGALRSSSGVSTAAEGGYSTLVQMNTVELCLPVIGLLLGPVLIQGISIDVELTDLGSACPRLVP